MSSINDDNWYKVKDLDGFINSTRLMLFNNFGKNNHNTEELYAKLSQEEQEELDRVLSYSESELIIKSLAKSEKNKKTKKISYIINDKIFEEILLALGDRMTSNILNGLVNKGLVEMAFDDEANDFVFWIKDK
jgi:hypothetical protein